MEHMIQGSGNVAQVIEPDLEECLIPDMMNVDVRFRAFAFHEV